MATDAQLRIKVIVTRDRPDIVTLCPNPKTEGVTLFFIGTSATSDIPDAARNSPLERVVVGVDSSKKRNEVIIVETRVKEVSLLHVLELSWKERGPYIDLEKTWTPKEGKQLAIQPVPLEGGGYCLRVQVKKDCYATHRCLSDSEETKLVPVDLLCQLAVGKISYHGFKGRIERVASVAEVSPSKCSAAGDYQEKCRLQEEVDRLNGALLAATDKVEELNRRLRVCQDRLEGVEKNEMDLQAQLRATQAHLKECQAQFENQTGDLEAEKARATQLATNLATCSETVTLLSQEKDKLDKCLTNLHAELASVKLRNEGLVTAREVAEKYGLPEVRTLMMTVRNIQIVLDDPWSPFRSRLRRIRSIIREETKNDWFAQRLKQVRQG